MTKITLYCRVKPDVQSKTDHLHGITELPIFAQPSKMLTTEKAIGVLLFSGLTEESVSQCFICFGHGLTF